MVFFVSLQNFCTAVRAAVINYHMLEAFIGLIDNALQTFRQKRLGIVNPRIDGYLAVHFHPPSAAVLVLSLKPHLDSLAWGQLLGGGNLHPGIAAAIAMMT